MKPAPTLFDALYRATFSYSPRRRGIHLVDHPERLRQHLRDARKFVLDDKMSSFLSDLSIAAFLKKPRKIVHRLVDQMRVMARLPHKLTWVEFDFRAAWERGHSLGITSPFDVAGETLRTGRQGWLLNQHPTNETLFRAHVFESSSEIGLLTPPFAFAWHTDDQTSVWAQSATAASLDKTNFSQSELSVGVNGYRNDRCGIVRPEYCDKPEPSNDEQRELYREFLRVYASTLRRIWALLATVNDIPIEARSIVATKGFVACGQYHRFLDHKVIVLRVPDTVDVQKIARKAVAASRRRAHQVRGHWRKDHWRPGEQIWVHEHQRGDASLGFVLHDYVIEHPEAAE